MHAAIAKDLGQVVHWQQALKDARTANEDSPDGDWADNPPRKAKGKEREAVTQAPAVQRWDGLGSHRRGGRGRRQKG